MKDIWIYEEYKDHELERKLNKILSNKSLINRVVKIIGLFNFIKKNNINTVEKLQKKVRKDGKPLFTKHQAEEVVKKSGGGKAYNALIQRGLDYAYLLTPESIKGILDPIRKFIFPLSEVPVMVDGNEQPEGWVARIPVTGQAVSMGLTIATEFNKTAAKLAQQYTPMIIGLVPIPFSAPVGIALGYMMSAMFIFFNMVIFTAQHRFGDVYIQSLALIPFVGLAFQNFGDSSDKFMETFAEKRQALIDQLRGKKTTDDKGNESYDGKLAFVGNFLDKFTFNPLESVSEEEMNKAVEKIKKKVGEATANVQKTVSKVQNDAKAYINPENRSGVQAKWGAWFGSLRNWVYQNSQQVLGKMENLANKTPEERAEIEQWLRGYLGLVEKQLKSPTTPEAAKLLEKEAQNVKDNLEQLKVDPNNPPPQQPPPQQQYQSQQQQQPQLNTAQRVNKAAEAASNLGHNFATGVNNRVTGVKNYFERNKNRTWREAANAAVGAVGTVGTRAAAAAKNSAAAAKEAARRTAASVYNGTAASAAAVGQKFRDSGIAGGGNKRLSRRKRKISNKVIHNKRFSRRKHNTSKWRTLKKR
jgi:hypothetical protein